MKKTVEIIFITVFAVVVGWADSSAHAVRFPLNSSAWASKLPILQFASNNRTTVRFTPLHIYLDSANQSLAAYQFELKATSGQIKIVGVEGGQHPAFTEAPYYDPAALANDRIIVAAFSTQPDLPKGKTRIATLHLQIIGDAEPQYELKLIVSADSDGKEIPAEITFEKGE